MLQQPNPKHTRHSLILRSVAALSLLYFSSVGYNCYELMQTRAWHARVNLAKSSYEVVYDLKEDKIFNGVVSTYIGGKCLVNEEFNRKIRHVEFYTTQMNQTQNEFATHMKRLFIPHF